MRTDRFAKLRIAVARLLILGAVAACLDDPVRPGEPLSIGLVVSNPISPSTPAVSGVRASTAGGMGENDVVYVSLAPETAPGGATATIRNHQTATTMIVSVVNGGFDPEAVSAQVGDVIEVVARDASGAVVGEGRTIVMVARRPVVVRVNPPPKKRDVPLNSVMIVVFSEPIDPATLSATTMYLLEGQTSVPGRLEFTDEAQLTAAFVPDALLTSGTDYQLVVTTGIEDLDGDSLETAVTVEFTSVPDPSSEVLATIPLGWGVGTSQVVAEMQFSLSMRVAGPDTTLTVRHTLFDEAAIRDGDDGTTLVAKAGTDDFAAIAALLTDGTDGPITTNLACGGTSGGSMTNESNFFVRGSSTGPDFAGYTIDSVAFHVDSVLIVSPGNGISTDCVLGGRLVVMGHGR